MILRACGKELNIPVRRVPDQGGTRKCMALARSAANLLTNFSGYCAGMHARLAQSQGSQKTGSQRVGHLVQAGRRLTSINFITFTLALQDILTQGITPICLMSEMSSAEATEVWRAVQNALTSLAQASLLLTKLRRWLFITVLVGQYTTRADLVRLWQALRYTGAGKQFPGVTQHMIQILLSQRYMGCGLTCDPGPDAAKEMVLSPRCQCRTMRQHPRDGPRHAFCMIRFGARRRRVRVPEWVAHSVYDPKEMIRDAALAPGDVAPRFVVVELSEVGPRALQGLRRYAGAPSHTRCKMPTWMPAVHAGLDSALRVGQDFLTAAIQEIQDYVGSVGANDHVRSVVESAAKCFDWEVLLRKPPRHEHAEAFLKVYQAMRPTLEHTVWPNRECFPHVDPVWPSARAMFQQYKLLLQRLRERAMSDEAHGVWVLRTPHAYRVTPVVVWRGLAALSRVSFLGDDRPLAVVTEFLLRRIAVAVRVGGHLEQVKLGTPFMVRIAAVCALGAGRGFLKARGRRDELRYRGTGFASIAHVGLVGRWVRVRATVSKASPSAVCRYVDLHSKIHEPTGDQQCWHACRLLHRCRLLRAPEAACERFGSFLHMLWSPVQGHDSWRMAARLFIREAGLSGSGSAGEEVVVNAIALSLHDDARRTAFTKKASKRRRLVVGQARDAPTELHEMMRRAITVSSTDREEYKPMGLPAVCAESLQKHTRQDGRGLRIDALPMFKMDPRTANKHLAHAEMRRRLQEWVESDDATEWRKNRDMMFGAPGIELGNDPEGVDQQ